MLLLCSESDQRLERMLLESTKAIMFFGTPHRGSDFSDLGETLRRVASAVGFDTAKQNVRTLEVDSGVLEECHRRFQQLQSRENLGIFTFQETRGVTGIAYLGFNRKVNSLYFTPLNFGYMANIKALKVVADASSQFTGTEQICSIDANHMDMCRFSSRDDIGYRRVTDVLLSILEPLSNSAGRRMEDHQAPEEDSNAERQSQNHKVQKPY